MTLFAEEIVLPLQLQHDPQPHWTRVLLTLLVEEAIANVARPLPEKYGTPRNHAIRLRDEALAWIHSDDRSPVYITFRDACDYLGLEPYKIRKAVSQPGFRLNTEWTFKPARGSGGTVVAEANLIQKIDRQATRRRISIKRNLRSK